MVRAELWHEIHTRFRLKEPKKSIARALDLDVRTVRRILRQKKPQVYVRKQGSEGCLRGWKDFIRQRLPAVGYCAQAVFEELRTLGFEGSYDTVKRFVHPLREAMKVEATVRFETPPGRQGQVDWGQCWTGLGGRRARVHLFVFTLGYSRRLFARATRDEKLATFLNCHVEAFDHFGGIPHDILYDNPKTVVLTRDLEARSISWNTTFWDFARYYGYRPRLCRPSRPQTKGKVESGVKYIKRFLRGKSFVSLEHLNDRLLTWIAEIADQRIHGTTHQKPATRFLEEQNLLIPHQGKPPYTVQVRVLRQVSRDCLVTFETNRYSVPYRYAGQAVEVQRFSDLIRIYHAGEVIATHDRCQAGYENRLVREHYRGIFQPPPTARFPSPSQSDVQVRDLAVYEAAAQGGAQ